MRAESESMQTSHSSKQLKFCSELRFKFKSKCFLSGTIRVAASSSTGDTPDIHLLNENDD